ncbi:hypothetical protein LZZ85_00475 [Terrimonas sp. NA20]|uniref:Prokaryotic YEATS domain-containing protein n=1 Tax=Terrimonas ginsenosidimutans TaxID=2908004 RepID=A0ABS9KK75_9BACT|nr:pYEATS domain-containing protein [Terrimonas ginsenosidimutans]MCG2612725.1 hypothetical protein [Terrimonas ginsenosidimutans]
MSAIPSNFPVDTISSVSAAKLEWFSERYTEEFYDDYLFGHFILAAYAAVPAMLTPDLLYKVWQNFNTYQWNDGPAIIHRIAVADVLLSPFCRETGFELYEMDPDIRMAFLEWLKKIEDDKQTLWGSRAIFSFTRVAHFVQDYHRSANIGATRWGKTYVESQELEALSYTDPVKAASTLFRKMQEQASLKQETDMLRTMDQFVKTGNRLQRLFPDDQDVTNSFSINQKSIIAFKDLIQHNSESFLQQLGSNQLLLQFISASAQDGGISLQVPETMLKAINEKKQLIEVPVVRTIYSLAIGVDQVRNGPSFFYSENNAKRFSAFVSDYSSDLQRECKLTVLTGLANTTQREILNALQQFRQAEPGDACVFFYSGPLAVNERNEATLFFNKDASSEEAGFASLNEMLRDISFKENVHLLIIIDIRALANVNRPILFVKDINPGGSVLVMHNLSETPAPLLLERQYDDNHFFTSLLDLAKNGGYRLSYKDLFQQLKLRLSMLDAPAPQISLSDIDRNEGIKERRFLTGEVLSTGYQYSISWDSQHARWIVDAGARQGLRPSLDFMRTILETEEELHAEVWAVEPDQSLLPYFDGDKNKVFKARLIQNALPKVKVAFAEDHPAAMKKALEDAIKHYDIHYIDIIDQKDDATFLIRNLDERYMLVQAGEKEGTTQEKQPVFDYQDEPFEFIKQIEYIAQWQGVVELNNTESRMKRGKIWFSFEKAEGFRFSKELSSSVSFTPIPDAEPVVLYYKSDGKTKEQQQPILRCKIRGVSEPLYLSVLYLGGTYEIMHISEIMVNPSEAEQLVHFQFEDDSFDSLPVFLDKRYRARGITQVVEYMKFFVSEKPIDVKAFEQEPLEFGQPVSRKGFDIGSKKTFNSVYTEWFTVTIPIRIVKEPEAQIFVPKNPYVRADKEQPVKDVVAIGRPRLIEELKGAINNYKVVIVSGPGRSGKSSIVWSALSSLEVKPVVFDVSSKNWKDSLYSTTSLLRRNNSRRLVFIENYEEILTNETPGSVRGLEEGLQLISETHTVILTINIADEHRLRYSSIVGALYRPNSKEFLSLRRHDAFRISIPPWSIEELQQLIKADGILPAYQQLPREVVIMMATQAANYAQPVMVLLPALQHLFDRLEGHLENFSISDYQSAGGLAGIAGPAAGNVFSENIRELYAQVPVTVADDLQKNRWGNKSEANGKKLAVELNPTNLTGLYNLRISIGQSSENSPLPTGEAAIFIHNTFDKQILIERFIDGVANFNLNGVYETFTLGAYTEDGTRLELDLNEQKGFPTDFYYDEISSAFKANTEKVYLSQRSFDKEDIQRGRWGGSPASSRKKLSASIDKKIEGGMFSVTLRVLSEDKDDPIRGSVAFFLHDSYANPIIYKKAINGEASITITVYEAFTIGAYTADGAMMEFDLNEIANAPEDFYSRSPHLK